MSAKLLRKAACGSHGVLPFTAIKLGVNPFMVVHSNRGTCGVVVGVVVAVVVAVVVVVGVVGVVVVVGVVDGVVVVVGVVVGVVKTQLLNSP